MIVFKDWLPSDSGVEMRARFLSKNQVRFHTADRKTRVLKSSHALKPNSKILLTMYAPSFTT